MLRSGDAPLSGETGSVRSRASRWRGLVVGLLGVTAAGGLLYGGLLVSNRPHAAQSLAGAQPLPDGSAVRVEKTTFGRTHRLGPPPNRFPWLPAWLTGVDSSTPVIEVGRSQDSMMVWLTQRHPAAPWRTLGLDWWLDYHLTDSHGCRFDDDSRERRIQGKAGSSSTSTSRGSRFDPVTNSDPTAMVVGAIDLESFPRREAAMTLKLLGAEWGQAAELTVANPTPGPYPEWEPAPLPQTQRDGDLAVELQQVVGVLDTWKMNGIETYQQSLYPHFRISQHGARTDQWHADDLRVSDATGNESHAYQSRLCLREKAWKLRARLWRTPEAKFTAAETWEVRGVPVQAPGKILALSGSTTLQNVKLELLGIAGRGSFQYKDGVPAAGAYPLPPTHASSDMSTSGSTSSGANGRHTESNLRAGRPHVGVRITGLPEDYHLSLLALDDRGRHIPSELSASMDSERYLGLDLPRDARTLTLRFMVHRCRTVEYLIRPPEFKRRPRG